MKKVMFLVKKHIEYFRLFEQAAAAQELPMQIVDYTELVFEYQQSQLSLTYHGTPIEQEFQVIYFRHIDLSLEKHIAISEYCHQHQLKILDPVLNYTHNWFESKNFVYAKLAALGFPLIDSLFINVSQIDQVHSRIGYPCVAKITTGAQGEGVHLCQSETELRAVFAQHQTDLLIQKYIENDGDLRVLVIGDRVMGAIKRQRGSDTEFRNNVSLGGTATVYDLAPAEAELAQRAATTLGYSTTGVDLIFDQDTQSWRILEINRTPQFEGFMGATGIDIPAATITYLKQQAS